MTSVGIYATGDYVYLYARSPKLNGRTIKSINGNFVYNVKVTRENSDVYYKHYPIVTEGARVTRWVSEATMDTNGIGPDMDFVHVSNEYKKTLYFNDGIEDGDTSRFHPYVTGSGTVTLSDGTSYPVRVDGEVS